MVPEWLGGVKESLSTHLGTKHHPLVTAFCKTYCKNHGNTGFDSEIWSRPPAILGLELGTSLGASAQRERQAVFWLWKARGCGLSGQEPQHVSLRVDAKFAQTRFFPPRQHDEDQHGTWSRGSFQLEKRRVPLGGFRDQGHEQRTNRKNSKT